MTAPNSISFLDSVNPFSIIYFTVCPREQSLAVCLSLDELPLIYIAVDESFVPSTVPFVISPLTFVNPAIIVYDYALALSLAFLQLAFVNRVFVLLDPKVLRIFN